MSGTSTTPTHVPILVRKSAGHHFCVGSRAGDGNSRNSFGGSAFLNKSKILPATASVATTPLAGNWIATFLPEWRRLAGKFERGGPIRFVRFPAIFPGRGTFCRGANLCRAFEAAGKPSFRTLLKPSKQSSRVNTVLSRPCLSFAASHAHNKAWSSQHDAQRNSASGA